MVWSDIKNHYNRSSEYNKANYAVDLFPQATRMWGKEGLYTVRRVVEMKAVGCQEKLLRYLIAVLARSGVADNADIEIYTRNYFEGVDGRRLRIHHMIARDGFYTFVNDIMSEMRKRAQTERPRMKKVYVVTDAAELFKENTDSFVFLRNINSFDFEKHGITVIFMNSEKFELDRFITSSISVEAYLRSGVLYVDLRDANQMCVVQLVDVSKKDVMEEIKEVERRYE